MRARTVMQMLLVSVKLEGVNAGFARTVGHARI